MTSKPHRHRLSTCHRHPTVPVTGFCASCLRERLADADHPSPPSPELRRTKSCSGSGDAHSASAEPRRRSCEVRARSTLSDLFTLDDAKKKKKKKAPSRNAEFESANSAFELGEERHNEEAVRVCDEDEEETKTMKEFIDLELRNNRKSNASGRDLRSFWDAASVLSEKLRRKWRWNHKLKKRRRFGGGGMQTQSEVGEYGLGRRSCDTDPRCSVDVGRISVDNDYSRFSFDAPRASWDGVLIGKPCNRLSPMVSVVEDSNDRVLDLDPGGSVQTTDYYRSGRRSFDRSSSHRRQQSKGEVDELKLISNANAKLSPATTELFYGAKLLIREKDLNLGDANVKSLSGDCVMGSGSNGAPDVATGVGQKGFKKFHKWRRVWSKLGLVQRREGKLGEGQCADGDVVNKPLAVAEPWQRLRRVVNVQASESVSQKLIRSYSVSCRNNPCRMAGLINSLGGTETKGNVLSGRQDFMLQRNRSVRYSPNNLDTGLLRFYLTPLKSYRRSKSGKSSLRDLRSIARSIF